MEVVLAMRLGIFNALFQNLLRLLDKLSVQVDCIRLYATICVILAENELGRLLVILFHFAPVGLALFRELFGGGAITARVGFLGLDGVRSFC